MSSSAATLGIGSGGMLGGVRNRRPKVVRAPRINPSASVVSEEPIRDGGRSVPTRENLAEHTLLSLAAVLSADLETVALETIETAYTLVNHLLDDGSATPQVSPASDGGVSVQWVVKQRLLSVQVHSEGEILVWAEDSDGTELFEYELTGKWLPTDDPVRTVKQFLDELSKDVLNRVEIKTRS